MKKSIIFFIIAAIYIGTGCSKMLETQDKNAVEADKHYNNFNDADNAILGIYGKLMGLVDRIVILNELRADLMDITENSTADMVGINNHTATAYNKYCDLVPFYDIILNCNDVLANFDKMKDENKLSTDDYVFRYSDVVTVRCWVYLQLAIHFGSIPYITEPLLTVADLEDNSRFTVMSFDRILEELIACMKKLEFMDLSTGSPLYGSSTNPDGEDMRMFFLNKRIMLGDLYLWTDQYVEAATQYYRVIEEAEIKMFSGSENRAYKIYCYVWDNTNEPGFQVTYVRYKGSDLNSFRNKWKEMFNRPSTNAELRQEMITMFSYNTKFAPQYPLIEIFANTGKGKYRLKPSDWAINGLWETQIQRENNFVFDGRGRESSFDYINGQPVVLKYLYDYYPYVTDANRTIHLQYQSTDREYTQQGKWFIYRAALLNLRYAEAANRAGYPDLAYALLNNGIRSYYDWSNADGSLRSGSEKEGVQYSGYRPEGDSELSVPYPEPFYLDGRFNDLPGPFIRAPWRDGGGIRNRGCVQNTPRPEWVVNKTDSIRWMEEALLAEGALELGFEGHRWGDMLRIALRKNKDNGTGMQFLNEILSKKFEYTGKPAPEITPANLYLPRKE